MSETAQATDTGADAETEPTAREVAANIPSAPDFQVPDAYKDAKWINEVNSVDDLWSRLADTQSLIGKKTIPGNDASDEEWAEYYSKTRPEKAEDYVFDIPEDLDIEVNEDFQGKVRDFFYEEGLTARQAQNIYNKYMGLVGEVMGEQPSEEQVNADFDEQLNKLYGDKANDAIKIAHSYLAGADADVKEGFAALPNNQMLAMVKILNDTHNKFGREDTAINTGGKAPSGHDINEVRTELAQIRVSPEFKDPTHPEHAKKKERVAELSAVVDQHYKGKSG